MTLRPASTLGALVLGLLASASLAAERPWVEVKSPHFTVVGNAGEKSARQLAWQLEQVRATFEKVLPWAKLRPGSPLLGVLARDETTFRSLAPGFFGKKDGDGTTAVFVTGRDRSYIALRGDIRESDDIDVNPYFNVYFGYVHIALNASLEQRLPLWLMRGLSGVFGNTVVRAKDVLIGPPVPSFFRTLAERPRLPIRTLIGADSESPAYSSSEARIVFDAQSWALVHWMIFGNGGQNLARFSRFMQIYEAKADQDAALKEAFGGEEAVSSGFSEYLSRKLISYRKAEVDIDVKLEGFAVRTLSDGEAKAARAALHVALRRPEEARALIEELKKTDPKLPLAFDCEGMLLDTLEQTDAARAAYERAVELGSTNFYTHYRHGTLAWRPNVTKDQLTRARDAARKSVELNPDYPWAQQLLADSASALDDTAVAVAAARRAVELQGGEPRMRLSLARALGKAGEKKEASYEAGRALTLARDDAARKSAQEMLDWIGRLR